jgi:hypothetical protein
MSRIFLILFASLVLSGCVSVPVGPSVTVLPAPGQSFDQFRSDDAICQQFAGSQLGGGTANDSAVNSEVGSAIVGTLLGAALGAAVGGGRGAAIGAGSGLVAGSVMGLGASGRSQSATQQRFDSAYIQCMYAKGHQVPVSGHISNTYQNVAPYQAAPPAVIIPPPPPPGYPPPPP